MTKSHVSMGQLVCPACGTKHESGEILFDKRLKPSMKRYTVTGWGLCPKHQKLKDEGYVALVEIDLARSIQPYTPSTVYRTGNLCHLWAEVAKRVFDMDLGTGGLAYVEVGVIEKLQAMTGLG